MSGESGVHAPELARVSSIERGIEEAGEFPSEVHVYRLSCSGSDGEKIGWDMKCLSMVQTGQKIEHRNRCFPRSNAQLGTKGSCCEQFPSRSFRKTEECKDHGYVSLWSRMQALGRDCDNERTFFDVPTALKHNIKEDNQWPPSY